MSVSNNANTYLPGVVQIPSSLVITAITNAYPAVATITVNTVTESNTFQEGQLVRMTIPITYKMFQMNGQVLKILDVSGSDITLDIDSRPFDSFVVPASPIATPASMAPSGSRNLQYSNETNQVAFQSLNNIGN